MMSVSRASSLATLSHRGSRASTSVRHCYAVFGGVLASELEFPELEIAPKTQCSSWTLLVQSGPPPELELTALGERKLGPETYRLWRSPSGLRLVYSHAGTFDISSDGTRMTWYYRADALPELVRNIVLGPALALALELAGFFCLHGSAVVLENDGLAFVGPKHHGKSTIASALTLAGARLVGDDLVAVAPGPPAMIRPGVASVRLWGDAVSALPMRGVCESLIPGVKTTATGFANFALMREPARLAAIYVLAPVEGTSEASCARTRLAPVPAAIALAHQTKLADSLVGMRAAGTQLAAAAAVARTVPVYTLSVARDLRRLPELVAQIRSWHQPSPGEGERSSTDGEHSKGAAASTPDSGEGEVCS